MTEFELDLVDNLEDLDDLESLEDLTDTSDSGSDEYLEQAEINRLVVMAWYLKYSGFF